MIFRQLFDAASSTFTYLLADPDTGEAVLLDPVLEQVERDTTLLEQLGLELVATLETHVHADHITAAAVLRERLGSQVIVPRAAGVTGADVEVGEGDTVAFGRFVLEVRPTPGHTVGGTTYVLAEQGMAFTGDTLFVRGCGRTDFQGGDAATLYRSVHAQIFTLPDATLLYPGHDYKGHTVTTVGEEKVWNPRLGGGRSEAGFVAIMEGLDLSDPAKMDVAVPANLVAGASAG
jgi:sulfur dioxygenase